MKPSKLILLATFATGLITNTNAMKPKRAEPIANVNTITYQNIDRAYLAQLNRSELVTLLKRFDRSLDDKQIAQPNMIKLKNRIMKRGRAGKPIDVKTITANDISRANLAGLSRNELVMLLKRFDNSWLPSLKN